jgi:hypothetical protein
MVRKLNLPFSNKKINSKLNSKINNKKGGGLLNVIKSAFTFDKNQNNNSNRLTFIKGSDTKEYYKKISKKRGGSVKEILFPAGLSAAATVLGLIALQHAVKKNMNAKKKLSVKKKSIKRK